MATLPFAQRLARWRALARKPAAPLEDFLRTPSPAPRTPLAQLELVAVDLETTGLDAGRDAILSIGAVHIRALGVALDTALHRLVQADGDIPPETAVIHRITDDHAAGGEPLEALLPDLLGRLAGRVLLVHHAALERRFLNAACQRLYGGPLVVPVVDTEWLARRSHDRWYHTPKAGELRLFNLRARYGLPRYPAHNALSDAVATAELFLAMTAEMAPKGGLRLRDVLAP